MSNSNQNPFDFLLQAAVEVLDDVNVNNNEDINSPKEGINSINTPKVNDTTSSIASNTRSSTKKKNNNKKRQASTPYETQQDTYGDTETLIDTGRGVDLAPEEGTYDSHLTRRANTPKRRRRSRSNKKRSKLFTALDVQIEDIDNNDDDDKDEEGTGGGDEDEAEQQPANNEEEEEEAGGVAWPKAINSTNAATRRRGHRVLKNAQQLLDRRNQIESMLPTKQASQLCNPDQYTCYMGTGIQTLVHMHCISRYFLNTEFMSDINDDNFNKCGVVALAFHTILRRIMCSERRQRQGINVREFKKTVDFSTRLFPVGQRDVMEFLTFLMSTLHESTTDITGRSRLSDVFSGDIISTTVCPDPECLHSRDTTESSWGLNLEIDPAAGDNEDALEMCFRKFCAPETLDENNTTECDACKNRVQQTRSMKYNAPPILFISFKRFKVTGRTGRRTIKNGVKLGFPMTLDMQEFAPPSSSVSNNHLYDLFAVINHDGTTLESGHYFLYIKIDDVWNVYNDDLISQILESQVVTDKAYALVYVKRSEFNQLILSQATQPVVGTIRPPRRAASNPARKKVAVQQKKTPQANTSASQHKKRSSSNTTADKSSTAGARKKRKTSSVSSQPKKCARLQEKRWRRGREPQRERFQQIEDDKKMEDEKKRGEQVPYFDDEFPDGMEIDKERTRKDSSGRYYCRNKHCTIKSKGKGGEKELCLACATKVRQYRRKLEFDEEFQFQLADDFDEILSNIDAHIHDSFPDSYNSLKPRNSNMYACFMQQQGITGLPTLLQSDSALVRQCLCVLYNIDADATMCMRNPGEEYLGKREKEATTVSDAPSVKEFFQELALWLFNKFYDMLKKDEDLKNRLRTILGYLEDPTQLHKLWEGEKFEPQNINCAKEELDMRQQFKCLHSLYDKGGHVRTTFSLICVDHHEEKKRMIAAIDAISMAFERDVKHHSSARSRTWVDREDDVKAFKKWLKIQRDILSCDNDDDLTQLVTEFKRQVQATIDEINTEKEDATRRRQQDDTTHPAVAHEQECITSGNPPPNYEKYMKDIIGDNIKTTQNQYKQDIEQLVQTAFYKKLKDAQNNNHTNDPRVALEDIKDAFDDEKSTNQWFRNKFRRVEWEGVCPFTNEEYVNTGRDRHRLIGTLYRRLLVRLAKKCMMKGCSIKPSDYDRAKQLYAFHLHHYINSGTRISSLTEDIGKMSEEAKKNCVVFCNGCHNHKEQKNVYNIPLNKLQNQLMYDEGDEHVSGRQLVTDFDLIVVVLKLFVLGGFRNGSFTRCTPDILRSIFYDHFDILFDDTVDYDVDDMFNNLDGDDECKPLVNSAILGALKKRSKRCPGCMKRFMNISSFHSTIIHWDHTEDKEFKGASLGVSQIVVMLNEIGRYLGATCAFCHGEQPKSPKKPRTWE